MASTLHLVAEAEVAFRSPDWRPDSVALIKDDLQAGVKRKQGSWNVPTALLQILDWLVFYAIASAGSGVRTNDSK